MSDPAALATAAQSQLKDWVCAVEVTDMVTVEVAAEHILAACLHLRDQAPFHFEVLIDICGVDYLDYGMSNWRTRETTTLGFSRGVTARDKKQSIIDWDKPRFAVVYHLLSLRHNHRMRLKVYLEGDQPALPSVLDCWASANWYEREAFDLFGIFFEGHPDLRRLLTDYGFKGHPFRKDFPLIGELEMRYDAATQRCVYEPVSITPRTLVPKVVYPDAKKPKQTD